MGVVGERIGLAEDRGKWRSIVVKAKQKNNTTGPHPFSWEEEEKMMRL